ncbi:diguanylate cyclase [Dactylosporangium sp. NPDC000555]|uniref:diguanylate cyclase n=1 Tax=Dactylosporangium sp. NPDC000555 TaxID=3154260 RepID=UPI003316932D
MSSARADVRDNRVWLGYLLAGTIAMLGYFLLPERDAWRYARVAVYLAISLSGAAAVWWGIARNRPAVCLPWLLLGLSQLVYASADAVFYVSHYVLHSERFPSFADLLYLGHYPPLLAALLLLIRRREPRSVVGQIDGLVAAVAAALLSWMFLIGPTAARGGSTLAHYAELAYPVLDLALVALTARLVIGVAVRSASFGLLLANLLGIAAADTVYSYQQLHGVYEAGNFLDAMWLTANLALGAATLHRGMIGLTDPAPCGRDESRPVRFLLLACAALLAPAALLVQSARGINADVPAAAVACAVLFLLTLGRMAGVAIEQRRLAVTDPLTGLFTRRFIEGRLSAEVARAGRRRGPVALFIADVDHFKSVNDRYGHPAGDRALVEIARRLRRAVRPGDVLARYGGEEFAVLMPGLRPEELEAVSQRLRRSVGDEPVPLDHDTRVTITVSIGTAGFPAHSASQRELVAVADRALYTAKILGRDRVVVGGARVEPRAEPGPEDGVQAVVSEESDTAPAVAPVLHLDYLQRVADEVDAWLSGLEHSAAIARWTTAMAVFMDCSEAVTMRAGLAGRFHDVGKVVIPREILVKAEPLTDEDWALLRRHPQFGARMCRIVPELGAVAEVIRQHHERFDGSGYPDGLRGLGIRPEARLIAVCDSWAAMRCDRPYQAALGEEQAREELLRGRGGQFAPDAVDAFLALHEQGAVGELRPLGPIERPAGGSAQSVASASVFQNISS